MPTLRLLLGDQLNHQHSWYRGNQPDVTYVLMEMRQETDYTQHHIQKVVAFFAAMRAFAAHLRQQGHHVIYYELNHPDNQQKLCKNIRFLLGQTEAQRFEYQLPDEWRLDQQLKTLCSQLEEQEIVTKAFDSEHFLSEREGLSSYFKGKKTYIMEPFYRMMRKKYGILMDGKEPLTSQWNYDADNRRKLPKDHQLVVPQLFVRDVTDLYQLIENQSVSTIGKINSAEFIWPVTREEGLSMLAFFVAECLENFGTFQDAMTTRGWSLYHARLSFVMNVKLLHPLEVVKAVIQHWETHQDRIDFAQVEGFVRQIIGWREYVRGVYWAKMPEFGSLNFFNNDRALPDWYWTGHTHMNCLKHAVEQSLDYAYAHHIQRLMITGNFAALAGIHPDEVDAWYLGIYIDAVEWVEITNTRGMSQFADGGIVGTKPYVSSANYVDKMSDYCGSCYYDKNKKTGDRACPLNSLYWHFYARNRDKLERNPRIGMMYHTWDKMSPDAKNAILNQAEAYLENLNAL
jgi:deoxyribodipyrimidine photolyase-related protein